jgi:crotonobetainyl-CoA:carnitine CoA-transferase CaiB-like acyl-CoA transferase
MPYTTAHWKRFFTETGHPEHADDPRFADISQRTTHVEPLYQILADILATRSTAAWLALFERLEVPASPMNALEQLHEDPHLAATGFFVELHDDKLGTVRLTSAPVKFDGARNEVRVPPRLGEHTKEVLREIGFSGKDFS